MPAAIGIAILGETLASTAVIAGLTYGTVVGYGVTSALALGAALVAQQLQSPKTAEQQLTVRQAIPPRVRGHGRAKLGGAIFFLDIADGKIYRGVVHCVGPITGIREFWLGDTKTGLTGNAGGLVPDSVYQGKVAIEARLGSDTQAASNNLLAFPYWSAAAQLKGLAYTVVVAAPLKHGEKIFPEGAPDVRIVADLAACFDPRKSAQSAGNPSSWAWTDNAGLALADLLNHDSAFGIPFAEMNLDSLKYFADTCDEDVALRTIPGAGGATLPSFPGFKVGDVLADGTMLTGTEKRYRSWGTYKYTEPRGRALARYLDACDGELGYDAEGRVLFRGGKWEEPTFTITEDMILGWDEFEVGAEAAATVNQVKFTYTSPLHDYQPTEGDPWDDAEAQARNGLVSTEIDLRNAPSHTQGRRLAGIKLAKLAPKFRFRGMRLKPAGLGAYGERIVRLILPAFDRPGVPFDFTAAIERNGLGGELLTEPSFDLYALDASAYASSTLTEGNPPPLPDQSVPTPPPIPSGIAYEIVRRRSSGSVVSLGARFSAAAVAGQTNLSLVGQYRPVGTTAWTDMRRDAGKPFATPLDDGASYEAQLAWLSGTYLSEFSAIVPFSAVADDGAPAAPTYASATRTAGTYTVSHSGTLPNSANARSLQLVRANGFGKVVADASVVDTKAGSPNQAVTLSDTIGLGLFRYWLMALNGSGVASAPAGPWEILSVQQLNNTTTAPNDLTNPAWVKTRLSAALSGSGPDGNAATLVTETATATSHFVQQTVSPPFASGSKLTAAFAIKAAGRTKGAISLLDSTAASNVRATFDLAAGTISAVTVTGSAVTSGVPFLVRISADWFIVTMTGVVAGTSAITRLTFADDTGSTSYNGDTSKGMYVEGATLAVAP